MHVPIIAFISDFGLQDVYVGVVKGVIAGISPNSKVIDLTHEIPAGDVRCGAIALWQSAAYFPKGTIYLGVVDPGVGTQRKAIICRSPDGLFVGPDNGLVSYLWRDNEVEFWEIDPSKAISESSNTFHGRDLFGPVAAHLANGTPGDALGTPLSDTIRVPLPTLSVERNQIRGEVLHTDHFGNVLTSIGKWLKTTQPGKWLLRGWDKDFPETQIDLTSAKIAIDHKIEISMVNTFADIAAGSLGALVGSSGLIEVVSNRASAASMLGVVAGEEITLLL